MNHDNRRPINAATRADLTARFSALDERRDPFGRDDPALDAMAEQILADMFATHSAVAEHYERKAPGFLAAYQAISFLPELARIAETAVAADRQMIDGDDGGPWVIFTTRPGERYALATPGVLDAALDTVAGDIACDLRRSWGGNGYCVSDMNMSRRHKLPPTDKSGKMLNRPFTFPFAHGEYLVLSRICIDCWIDFVKHYEIKDVRIQNPWETLG